MPNITNLLATVVIFLVVIYFQVSALSQWQCSLPEPPSPIPALGFPLTLVSLASC